MNIGIVQPLAGGIGGRDKLLDEIINALKDHNLTLFTFTKPLKKYSIPVKVKVPVKIPFLGIYQRLFMPNHNYSGCDVVISAVPIKTDRPTIIYDHSNEFDTVTPIKYRHGFWKLYYLPYKFFKRKEIASSNAIYKAVSIHTADLVTKGLGRHCDIIYPAVDLTGVYKKIKLNQVCVVGRISPEKNLVQVIEILNKVDCHCIIAGVVSKMDESYFKKLKEKANTNITFVDNISRVNLLDLLAESRVYFSASKETFGIATIEAIASGCIPIIPDNSANIETVFYNELRYNSNSYAIDIINQALEGDCDGYLDELQEHIKQFNQNIFKEKLITSLTECLLYNNLMNVGEMKVE